MRRTRKSRGGTHKRGHKHSPKRSPVRSPKRSPKRSPARSPTRSPMLPSQRSKDYFAYAALNSPRGLQKLLDEHPAFASQLGLNVKAKDFLNVPAKPFKPRY